MTLQKLPEEPNVRKSLNEIITEKRAQLDRAIDEYCDSIVSLRLRDKLSNGLSLPQDHTIRPTIKSIIIQLLKQNPSGVPIKTIRTRLKAFGLTPKSETISSTLNRLKNQGIIIKSLSFRGNWRLREFEQDGR